MAPDQRQAELTAIGQWIGQMANAFTAAANACQADDTEEWRYWRDYLRNQLPKNSIIKSSASIYVNSRTIFVTGETISINTSLTLCKPATKITTMYLNGKPYLPDAIGSASLKAAETTPSSSVYSTAQVVKDSDPNSLSSYEYCVPAGTQVGMNLQGGVVNTNLSGTISISGLVWNAQSQQVGVPTGVDLVFSDSNNKISMSLDKTNSENSVVLDANGNGAMNMAVSLSGSLASDDFDLSPFKVLWVRIPVARSADGQTLVLGQASPMLGVEFAPIDPMARAAMESGHAAPANPMPPMPTDPCVDTNNNGIWDIIEWQAHNINCQMKGNGCDGYENVEGCL